LAEPIAVKRRLAAIFAADVEGYSRLMEADEVTTFANTGIAWLRSSTED
jgi:class 3 adenylate cyclase